MQSQGGNATATIQAGLASAAIDCAVPGGEARQDKVRVVAIAKLIVCVC